jgi:hypothetical protein
MMALLLKNSGIGSMCLSCGSMRFCTFINIPFVTLWGRDYPKPGVVSRLIVVVFVRF